MASEVIEELELIAVTFTSLNITGNNISNSDFISATGVGIYIENSIVQSDIYTTASFYWSKTISTFLVSNFKASNLTLQSESTFISAGSSAIRSLQVLFDFIDIPEITSISRPIYGETRPFILYNCMFNITNLIHDSVLITSTNPQAINSQNIFSVENLNTSMLLMLGNYQSFLNSGSEFDYFGVDLSLDGKRYDLFAVYSSRDSNLSKLSSLLPSFPRYSSSPFTV